MQTETVTFPCLSEATCGRISGYLRKTHGQQTTRICKTCNAEISRGGASAKTFSTSGLIYHLKSKHSDRYAEYERNAAQKRKTPPSTPTPSVADVFEKARKFPSDIWAMAVFVLIHVLIMLKVYRENIVASLSSCTCSECTFL